MAYTSTPAGSPASGGQRGGARARTSSALRWAALLLLLGTVGGAGENPCWAEQNSKNKLLYLVARPSILDPIFARSVVLMLPLQGEPLIVGLIVNKPTQFLLLKLFPESPSLKNSTEDAYLGGPVDVAAPALAFHASKPPKQAMPLYDDVYLSFDSKFISKQMQDPKRTGEVRLFLGRAQWAPEQLHGEALRGSWYSLRAEGEVIFDHDSEHLWKRLHERARPPSSVEYRIPQGSREALRVAVTSLLPNSTGR